MREVGLAWGASPVLVNRLLNTVHILSSSSWDIKREKLATRITKSNEFNLNQSFALYCSMV